MTDWTPTAKAPPPENVIVQCMDSGGHVQNLQRRGYLYFFPNESAYVYFVPQFWRAI